MTALVRYPSARSFAGVFSDPAYGPLASALAQYGIAEAELDAQEKAAIAASISALASIAAAEGWDDQHYAAEAARLFRNQQAAKPASNSPSSTTVLLVAGIVVLVLMLKK